MRQRYYNTEIKRFINQDIVVGSIDNSQSLNRYSYVQGNPVTLTDPFGLSPSAKDIIMGAIHGLLDVVGCSPELIGMGANLINAALYAFVDHDYGMAALSLLAGVTFGAAKVVAMGGKFAKAAKTVETVGRFVSNVASFAICTKQAVDVGSEMWQKYYVEGKSLDGGSAMEFLTLGLNMAGMAMSGKGMVESGNKICKSIKESGVTSKISGKVKYWAKSACNNNKGKVDLDAPVVIGGSNTVDSNKKLLFKALKKAPVEYRKNPKSGIMEPYMKQVQISDDYKIILRRDVGDFNHGDLDHWNLEVQTVQGRNIKYDLHIYLGDDGNILPFTEDNIYIPKKSPFNKILKS